MRVCIDMRLGLRSGLWRLGLWRLGLWRLGVSLAGLGLGAASLIAPAVQAQSAPPPLPTYIPILTSTPLPRTHTGSKSTR